MTRPRHVYMVVEGYHDAVFISELLCRNGMRRIRGKSDVPEYWHPLIPLTFPINDDLLARVPVPLFLEGESVTMAIHSAGGVARLISRAQQSIAVLEERPAAIAFVLDADTMETPEVRYAGLRAAAAHIGFRLPTKPGGVLKGPPTTGAFVMPDNSKPGTIEDVLLACAKYDYAELLKRVGNLVSTAEEVLPSAESAEFLAPAGHNKATVGCLANILKPSKSVSVSLQDNNWLCPAALADPLVSAISTFLNGLTLIGDP